MRTIDADALIEEYDRIHVGPPGRARKLIEDAPTIEPEPHWIPCSERLPDKDGEYLTTLIDKEGAFVDITEWQNIFGGRWIAPIDECDYSTIGNVIAWMRMPEPWKGEQHETKNKPGAD